MGQVYNKVKDMMSLRSLRIPTLALALGVMAGCGGSYSGVQAHAPAPQDDLIGQTPDSGSFTLYEATGYMEDYKPSIRPVWTVGLAAGQRIGFHWETDKQDPYRPYGSFHLIAVAGGQSRDLGPFYKRDLQYVWAGANADVNGYFQAKGMQKAMNTLLLQ